MPAARIICESCGLLKADLLMSSGESDYYKCRICKARFVVYSESPLPKPNVQVQLEEAEKVEVEKDLQEQGLVSQGKESVEDSVDVVEKVPVEGALNTLDVENQAYSRKLGAFVTVADGDEVADDGVLVEYYDGDKIVERTSAGYLIIESPTGEKRVVMPENDASIVKRQMQHLREKHGSDVKLTSADVDLMLTRDDLYDFQEKDVRLFSSMFLAGRVGLNFNEMGLGKTPEAIFIANSVGAKRILVVCPKTALGVWRGEIRKWDLYEPAMVRNQTYSRWDDFTAKFEGKWFVVNVDTFRSRQNWKILEQYHFDFVIFDEAHHMRNIESASKARGVRNFLRTREAVPTWNGSGFDWENMRPVKILLMTGSPVVNAPTDVYPMLNLADPLTFPTQAGFVRDHCLVEWGYKREKAYGFLRPTFIQEAIASHGIQRKKKDVLVDLPDKTYKIISLEMDLKQREFYQGVVQGFVKLMTGGVDWYHPNVLTQLLRMRQASVDPQILGSDAPSVKTEFMREFVESMGGAPFVVYTTFETYVSVLQDLLDVMGVSYGRITGKEGDPELRANTIKAFQAGEIQAVIATIQSGGEAITLTRASDVVLVDRWWTPLANDQAVDRLHRISQENAVTVHVLQCDDSIDQHLDEVLGTKRMMAESIQPRIDAGTATAEEQKLYADASNVGSIQREVVTRMLRSLARK